MELSIAQACLDDTQADLEGTQASLEDTQDDLEETQASLVQSQTGLEEPQADFEKSHGIPEDAADTADGPSHPPGGLLAELERRQDEVLEQLDALNLRIEATLRDCGVTLDDQAPALPKAA